MTDFTSSAANSGHSVPVPLTSSCEEALRQATDALDQCWDEAGKYVREKPVASLGIAFGIAFLLGLMLASGSGKCCNRR